MNLDSLTNKKIVNERKLDNKSRLVLPLKTREKYNIAAHDFISFYDLDGALLLIKTTSIQQEESNPHCVDIVPVDELGRVEFTAKAKFTLGLENLSIALQISETSKGILIECNQDRAKMDKIAYKFITELKVDDFNRIIIPTAARAKYDLQQGSKVGFIEDDTFILFKKANANMAFDPGFVETRTIDVLGRLVLPKFYTYMFGIEPYDKVNIFENDELLSLLLAVPACQKCHNTEDVRRYLDTEDNYYYRCGLCIGSNPPSTT